MVHRGLSPIQQSITHVMKLGSIQLIDRPFGGNGRTDVQPRSSTYPEYFHIYTSITSRPWLDWSQAEPNQEPKQNNMASSDHASATAAADEVLMGLAARQGGIEPLLRTFFSFLHRKTVGGQQK